jgi:uncharacterized protein (DUF697 family)/tellurite resistance protein
MNASEQRAILTVCLMAAFADGGNSERERAAIKRIADTLSEGGAPDASAIYQDVLLHKPDLATVAAAIAQPEQRQFAYEMAVCVCDADGATTPAERAFLAKLAQALGLDAGAAQAFTRQADAVSSAPIEGPALDGAIVAAVPANGAELDRMILNYATLNGALELLPQSLGSMAIIPLQMKMVYRIGAQHGVPLDRGQVTELLGALGIGLTGQLVENFARKLLGGFARKAGGKMFGGLTKTAVGAAATFATTYAIGQVAQAYYAGGRRLDPAELKRLFAAKSGEAQALYSQYRGEIETRAKTIDVQQLLPMIRGQ